MNNCSYLIIILGILLLGLANNSVATNVSAEKPFISVQPLQGDFSSPADQANFEQALQSVFGPGIQINHPDDDVRGGGAPGDGFGISVAISGDTALVGAPGDDTLTGAGSVYVFERSQGMWRQQAKLIASDTTADSGFGRSLALEGNTAVIGAPYANTAIANTGAAYVFARTGEDWIQQAKLTASDADAFDQFGFSTALSGDTILIGAFGDDAARVEEKGSAYVYVRSGSSWQQQAKLIAENGVSGDVFGIAVALSGDTAVVGAPRNDSPSPPDVAPGSVYVFVRSGTTWSQQAEMYDGRYVQVSDRFGQAVAVSGDAILVGAPENDMQGYRAGSAYFYTRSGNSWSLATQLFANDPSNSRQFGNSVALTNNTAAVGSLQGTPLGSTNVYLRIGKTLTFRSELAASDAAFQNTAGASVALFGETLLVGTAWKNIVGVAGAGAVSVFNLAPQGGAHEALLSAGDGAGDDQFGASIAVFGDTALVGVPLDDQSMPNVGSVFVFARQGAKWLPSYQLVPPDQGIDSRFGLALALSGDTAVVGAPYSNTAVATNVGAAYVFVRSGAEWLFQTKLSSKDGAADDLFGGAVAIAGDTIVVGARYHDLPAAGSAGAAYVFNREGISWSQQAKLTASDATLLDYFGTDVALEGDEIVIGAVPNPFSSATRPGAAYVYARSGSMWTEKAKLASNAQSPQDGFGTSLALSGNTMLVGAPFSLTATGRITGSVFVFVRDGLTWRQQAQLFPNDQNNYAGFGSDVSLSGDTALIGAPYAYNGGFTAPPGPPEAIYFFNRSGVAWSQSLKVTNSAARVGIGASVALSADATWVGAPRQRSLITGDLGVGTVYLLATEFGFQSGFED